MSLADRRQLPNLLTVLRLVLAAAFFAALNVYRYPDHHREWANVALGLFIVAAITDWLDGYLARRWEAVSVFGRIMDPFCDKVLVMGAFIYLSGPRFIAPEWVEKDAFFTMASGVYPWMVVTILARELLVTGIRGVVESMGVEFASRWSGKWKMILQSISIPVVLFLVVNFETSTRPWAMWTCHVLVYLTLVVTVWSGLPYIGGLRKVLAARDGGDGRPPGDGAAG
ncbi:MAG: CDP-alcohol phosphatidyltransferase family protein [Planctomycetota bacterium]|jgi:phosphatidylglycerophosphate synthase